MEITLKFKIGDIIEHKVYENTNKGVVINILDNGQYYKIKWPLCTLENTKNYIEETYQLSKQTIWNNQLKELLND